LPDPVAGDRSGSRGRGLRYGHAVEVAGDWLRRYGDLAPVDAILRIAWGRAGNALSARGAGPGSGGACVACGTDHIGQAHFPSLGAIRVAVRRARVAARGGRGGRRLPLPGGRIRRLLPVRLC